jgi:cyclic beta-1,2-glucan synthetase
MSAEKNSVKASGMKKEILLAAEKYRRASKRILNCGENESLRYAATLSYELCLRAKSAARNIDDFEKRDGTELVRARALMESYVESAEKINESTLCAYLFSTGEKYGSVTLSALPHVLFAVMFLKISDLVYGEEEGALAHLLHSVKRLNFIDFTRIFFDLSATDAIFSSEHAGVYPHCDLKTKEKYIEKLLELAKKEGRSEAETASRIVHRANGTGVHVGQLLFEKNSAVPKIYSLCLCFITLALAAIYFLLCELNLFVLLVLPCAAISCYSAVKELLALCFKYAGGDGLMRLDGKMVKEEKAVVAIMSIISGAEGDEELFERIENFYVAEENPNRFYAIVCNLPDSPRQKGDNDENIIASACARIDGLNAKYGNHFGIFIRRRRYSRSEEKYIGWERKRGAVLELCRFMRGEETSICRYIADVDFLSKAKYLITLDSDTNLYAGAADELIGTMLHPLNTPKIENGRVVSGHGIIQPHIAPTLESAASSAFATVTAGNGGIDSYAGAAFDIYENVFENGCFCGKGILDVDVFLKVCGDFFPCERILSHDLLEGNMAGAAIASDITLTDSAPRSAAAYYTRLHRWVRGDLQTLPYLLPYVKNAEGKRIKNPMNALDRYKIADNLIGEVLPLTSLAALFFIAFTAAECLLISLPFLFAFIIFPVLRATVTLFLPGGAKMAARKFHSRVMPHIMGGLAYSVYKLCALPYEAYIFGDAAVRTAYRFLVSKKNFLNWKTAAAADGEKNGYLSYIKKMYFSSLVGVLALMTPGAIFKVLGVAWLLFPTLAYLLSIDIDTRDMMTKKQKATLSEYAAHMWGYFRDLVGDDTNHLPPDNYALSPAERVAYRTSPTNIGLYLASLLGARDMGFITSKELALRAQNTLQTVNSMAKWHGHLYNWYEIKTLDILGEPFVSTVDSGNFICALCAFCEGIKEYAGQCTHLLDVVRLCEIIVKNTDFSALYDKSARLFYIGYDVKKERFSESYYDTFMSESRMTGYYAVASGQVPREHFFATSRPVVSSGGYIGIASWSGTVFEYFMPALFLPTVPNSLTDEALSFAYRTEKQNAVCRKFFGKKRKFFGVSESGYWQFDADMNYQYKAFGLTRISLDPHSLDAPVVSPYSSFLMLRCDVSECLDNLSTLKKLGAYGAYGFYEAVDCDRSRVGKGYAIVKSFMAHHVGMSFIAAVNALKDDVFPKRFMRAPKMRAYGELLCEKICTFAKVAPHKTKISSVEKENPLRMNLWETEKIKAQKTAFNIAFPEVAMLSNNKTRLIASSSGHIAVYNGEKIIFRSEFNRFSIGGGLMFYLVADGEVYPLVPLCTGSAACDSRFEFAYDEEKITYISRHKKGEKELEAHLTLRICGDREVFSAECRVQGDVRRARLFAYGEPVMESEKSFLSHKCFSNLFLESRYAGDEDALVFSRRSRFGEESANFMAVRAYPPVYGGDFDTKRDDFLPKAYGEESISALALAGLGGGQGAMITPMLAMRTYNCGARGSCGFTFASSGSEDDALFLLTERHPFSGKVFLDVARLQRGASGIINEEYFLKNYLMRCFYFGKNVKSGISLPLPKDIFWRHGISGENNTVVARIQKDDADGLGKATALLRIFKYMCVCGERFDLIFIYTESDLYRNSRKSAIELCVEREGCRAFLGRENGIHLVSDSSFSGDELGMFCGLCSVQINLSSSITELYNRNDGYYELSREAEETLLRRIHTGISGKLATPENSVAKTEAGSFVPYGFSVSKPHTGAPFAYVLSNDSFGCVLSENSLGFSYFENSALGKLTPHRADALAEDSGERLILRVYASFGEEYEDYDLCTCAICVDFEGGRAVYRGEVDGCAYTVCVEIDQSAPIKRVRAELSGNKAKTALIFSAEPCLGQSPMNERRYVFSRGENGVFVSDTMENPIMLAVFSDGKNVDHYENEGDFISDGRIFCGREIAALKIVPEDGHSITDFYLGAVNVDFSKDDLVSGIASFKARELEPMLQKNKISTKNPVFDLSVNMLFPYQTYHSRFTARTGFYQVGGAYGYRDQLQDSLSFIENAPELCRAQIIRCAAHQYTEGDAAHWWHVYGGKETGLRSRYSDDLLWLPFALCEYVEKTGDTSVLWEKAPYLSSPTLDERESERYEELCTDGEGTVLEHALRASHLALERGFGVHGLLKIGGGDWNDGMNLVGARGRGESVWLTEFFAIICVRLSRLMRSIEREEDANFFEDTVPILKKGVDNAFSGAWYLRGYYDDGRALGKPGDSECEIDSLSQSFAVFMEKEIYGEVSNRTKGAMLAAYDRLYRGGIMKLLDPPFGKGEARPGYIKGYPEGIRENGGQYTHAAVWAAMALLMCGETEKGTRVLLAINPAVRSLEADFCEKYRIEPYAMAGDVYAHSECFGRGGWSHYTGAAAWYKKAVLCGVFGLRTEARVFRLEPHMDERFDGATLTLDIRDTKYRIRYVFGGENEIILDGEKSEKALFPFDGREHDIEYRMKKKV